jgi:hypothetical protein
VGGASVAVGGTSAAALEVGFACPRCVALAPMAAKATAPPPISAQAQAGGPPESDELAGAAVAVPDAVVGVAVVAVVVDDEPLACDATAAPAATAAPG